MSVREWQVYGTVVSVHDGDTFSAYLDLGWGEWQRGIRDKGMPIRVASINAPELKDADGNPNPAGIAAMDFARTLLVPGSTVRILSHSLDKWRRCLASVTLADGRDFATLMLAAGHATPYEGGKK